MRILYIEDDAHIQRMMTRVLRRAFETASVMIVDTAPKAIALLRDTSYDLIVSDYNLIASTGGEVLQWLHAEKPYLVERFVFFSDDPVVRRLHDKVITKPCPPGQFITVLRTFVGVPA